MAEGEGMLASANGGGANGDVAGMAGLAAMASTSTAAGNPMAAAIAAAQQQAALQQAVAQQAQQGSIEGASTGSMAPAGMNPMQLQQMQMMQMMAAMGGDGGSQLQMMQMMQQLGAMGAQPAAGQTTAALQANTAQTTVRSAPYEQSIVQYQGGYKGGGEPSGNLFIGAIPRALTDEDLRSLFSPLGTLLSCKISIDQITGNSKGFGFVKFASGEDAGRAIEALNGHSGMQVKYATNDASKGGGKGGPTSDNLYVRGLPSPNADPEQLIKLFTDLGLTVSRHKLIVDTKGVGSSAAMVQLSSVEEAQSAITQLNGKEQFGNMLFLSFVEAAKGYDMMGGFATSRPLILKVKPAGEDARGDNLFVGGLPSPTVEQAQLANLFESRGYTVVRSKMLPDTRGKGASSALVQLGNRDEANAAIEQLNGQLVEGIGLTAAQLSDPNDPSTFDERRMPIHGNLFIGNIPKTFSEKELVKMFEECGNIKSCKLSRHENGESKGSGFVKFESSEEAKIAIDSLHGFNNLVVKPADFDIGAAKGLGKGKEAPAWNALPAWNAWPKGGLPGKDAKVIPPRIDADFQPKPFEQDMTAKFAGINGDDDPSDTVFILGLPSPVVEEHRLLAAFVGMGATPGKIETIPDDTDSQCSAAMVQFASIEAASHVRTAVDGKKPSELGLAAKGASKGHALLTALKGIKGKSYGKGAAPQVIPGPYTQKGWGKGEETGKGWWDAKGEQASCASSTAAPGGGSWKGQTADEAWGPESSSDAPAQFGQGGKGASKNAWNFQGGGDGGWGAERSSDAWQGAGTFKGGNGAWGKAEAWPSGGKNGAWGGEAWAGKGSPQAWPSQAWLAGGKDSMLEP